MGSYYYLIAQLPYLIYGQDAPISSGRFKDLCREQLGKKDLKLLELCSLDPAAGQAGYARPADPVSSKFINSWKGWERALRLHLAKFRAQNLKRDNAAPVDPPQDPLDTSSAAKTAMTMDSPLEAELYLDKARWNAIDALEGLEHFGLNTVFAYLLKLYLIERHSLFNAEGGFGEYKLLYNSIINQASVADNRLGEAISTSNESGEPK